MKVKNEYLWRKAHQINKGDDYGMGVLQFAERWADAMELGIANGELIADIALQAGYDAAEGVTGFMVGMATDLLCRVWEYGSDLRTWHNRRTAPSESLAEGATDMGVTLNPAVVTLGEGCISRTPDISQMSGQEALDLVLGGKKND